jgi:sugar/nucleoside kinase (ribokinase family)
LLFTPKAHTGLAFVSLRADGERELLFYRSPSADVLMSPDDVDEAAIRDAKVFYFGSVSLIADPARAATLHAVDIARRHGKMVTYDPICAWRSGPIRKPRGTVFGMVLPRRTSSRSAKRSSSSSSGTATRSRLPECCGRRDCG